MYLKKEHIIYSSIPAINEMSKQLELYVNFLNYIRIYDSGHETSLISNEHWLENYLTKYWDGSNKLLRQNVGINYWKRNANQTISEIAEDARNNFDIDARIE